MPSSAAPLTRRGLVEAGRGRAYGDRRVDRGEWLRVAPSVFLPRLAQLRDRVEAALLHAGSDAIVTGWAACEFWGMPYVVRRQAVDVLVPQSRRRVSTAHVRVVRARREPPWEVGPYDLRLAAPARAVVDAAHVVEELRDVRALVLGAEPWTTAHELQAQLRSGSARGRTNISRALDDFEAGARSAPEAELADRAALAARQGRFPRFLLNPEVRVDGVLVGVPDGWVPGLAMGWEQNSRQFHGAGAAAEATSERADRFVAYGLSLLGLTPQRTRRVTPDVTELLVAAAAARARSLRAEPTGLVVVPSGPLLPRAVRGDAVLRRLRKV